MKKVLITMITLLLLAAFGISAFQLYNYYSQSQDQQSTVDHLSDLVANAQAASNTQPQQSPTSTLPGSAAAQDTPQSPAQNPAENPVQNPAEDPVQNPAENPAQNPVENPAQSSAENPAQNPVENPAQNPVQSSVQTPAQNLSAGGSTPVQTPTEAPTEPTAPPEMLAGYKLLYDENPYTVGWIKIPDTKVNYPVLQTPVEKRDFYIDHDFYGNYSVFGSIYAREECDIFRPSDNITIYGHHMKDGSMFAGLNSYTSQQYWEEHNLIFFDTLYEFHTYKIFAVFKTSANLGQGFSYHQFIDAENAAEFDDFVSTCKKLAFYDTGITPVWGDKLICLSTCEYTLDNGRLVVAAVRIS